MAESFYLQWGKSCPTNEISLEIGLLCQPRMTDVEYRAVGEMRIGRGNQNTRREPASLSLLATQIPHDVTWAPNRLSFIIRRSLSELFRLFCVASNFGRPPPWSSGQSSWLQIQRSWFHFRRYQIF
jgi:hypothetical protein